MNNTQDLGYPQEHMDIGDTHKVIEQSISNITHKDGSPIYSVDTINVTQYSSDESIQYYWHIVPSPHSQAKMKNPNRSEQYEAIDMLEAGLAGVCNRIIDNLSKSFKELTESDRWDFKAFATEFNDILTIHRSDETVRITLIYTGLSDE